MKTTIEIADDLFERVQKLAREKDTTFRALTEEGLRLVLKEKQSKAKKWKWKPIICGGGFASKEVANMSWEQLRDEFIYPPRLP